MERKRLTERKLALQSRVKRGLAFALSMLLALSMSVALIPGKMVKAYTETPTKLSELAPDVNDYGSVSQAHTVNFAGKEWYVIGYNPIFDR